MDCRSCVGEMETALEVAEPEIIDPKESRLLYVADPGEFHDSADMMDEGCVDEAEIEKEESSESSDSDQDDDPDDTGNMLDFLDPDEKIFADTLSDDSQSSYPNYDVECKFVEVNPKLNHEEGEEYEDQTCDDEYSENQSMSIQADECDDQDRPSENYLEADYEGATPDDQRISSARDVSKAVSEKSTPRTSSAGRKRKYYKSKKVYVCPICDHVFHSHSNRRAHMRVHTNERPFTCAHCDRRFVQKSALKVHIRIHTGEKPYSCSICNRQFSRKSCMNMHEMVHSNEKPFSCSLCDYACKYEAALRKHKRTHTGEKPYSCSVCQNTFTSRIGMREHERIHTGEQPYSCTLCPYRTSRYSSLRRHKECHYRRKFTKEEIEVMITDLGPE